MPPQRHGHLQSVTGMHFSLTLSVPPNVRIKQSPLLVGVRRKHCVQHAVPHSVGDHSVLRTENHPLGVTAPQLDEFRGRVSEQDLRRHLRSRLVDKTEDDEEAVGYGHAVRKVQVSGSFLRSQFHVLPEDELCESIPVVRVGIPEDVARLAVVEGVAHGDNLHADLSCSGAVTPRRLLLLRLVPVAPREDDAERPPHEIVRRIGAIGQDAPDFRVVQQPQRCPERVQLPILQVDQRLRHRGEAGPFDFVHVNPRGESSRQGLDPRVPLALFAAGDFAEDPSHEEELREVVAHSGSFQRRSSGTGAAQVLPAIFCRGRRQYEFFGNPQYGSPRNSRFVQRYAPIFAVSVFVAR
mmetsp:Transcript_39156/g.117727  ORF Transcript_39156/g.117727 Transcript_39156/m.117727 type:complete len:352 (-) Transcript_39156:338-1393(-)